MCRKSNRPAKSFPVASVQNRYNITDRGSEEVVEYCAKHNLGFIPWFPVAAGELAKPGGALEASAKRHNATVAQLSLAWLLHRSPVMLPIPGTSSVQHLEENVSASGVQTLKRRMGRTGKGRGSC